MVLRVVAHCFPAIGKLLLEFVMAAANRQEADAEISAPDGCRPRRMLNEKQVLDIVPLSRTSVYRLEKAGKFPRSTYISPNRRVWFEDEIVAWQNAVDEFDPNRGRGKGRRRHGSD
jgi:prophage regulatory protein